jgi:hypothetical protein
VGDSIWHYDGVNWRKDLKPTGTGKLNAVYFASPNLGWAVGTSGTIIQYSNGLWTKITDAIFSTNHLYGVVGSDNAHIWVLGNGKIYFFNGTSWTFTNLPPYSGNGKDLQYINNNNIWALTTNKVLHFNGLSWSEIPFNTTYAYARSLSASPSGVWANYNSNSSNSYYFNKFNGVEFITIKSGGPFESEALEMFSDTYGWTAYSYFYYWDGISWKSSSPYVGNIYCIKMTSEQKGWAVGTAGQIFRYLE